MTRVASDGGWPETGFAALLRERREAAGLTQLQLAWRCGVEVGTISRLEAGRNYPVWPLVCLLADALGVSTEALRTTDCLLPEREGQEPPNRPRGRPRNKPQEG